MRYYSNRDLLVTLINRVSELTQAVNRLARGELQMSTNLTSLQDAITELQADVAAENTVVDGAVTLIEGIPALIAAAVAEAQASGATPEQLAAFGTLADTIKSKSSALATAVATAPGGTPAQTGSPSGSLPAAKRA